MRTTALAIYFGFFVLRGCAGFRWTGGVAKANAVRELKSCKGEWETVLEPWDFQLGEEETLRAVTWFLQRNSSATDDSVIIASMTAGQPFQTNNTCLNYVPPTGVEMLNASSADSGTYIVVVTVDASGITERFTRSVFVRVLDAAEVVNSRLSLTVDGSAMEDGSTGEWFVYLRCGQFLKQGHVRPLLATPSGQMQDLDRFTNGSYVYRLTSNSVSGEYRCLLPSNATCADQAPPANASLQVDMTSVRTTLLQSRLNDVIEAEEEQLQRQLAQSRERVLLQQAMQRNQREFLLRHGAEMRRQREQLLRHQLDVQRLQKENERLRQAAAAAAASSQRVGFCAQTASISPQPTYPQAIIAKGVLLNQGGGYDPNTGRFTAPCAGLYLLAVTVTAKTSGVAFSFWLVVDNGSSLDINRDSLRTGFPTWLTVQVLWPLKTGQQVWIMANDYRKSYSSAFFTGFLVTADTSAWPVTD